MDRERRTLLKGGEVVNAGGSARADVLLGGGRILAVGEGLSAEGAAIEDVSGLLLFPGFIDTHTHFDLELGNGVVTADDFPSGTAAAILGGTTTILDFATQSREGSLQAALEEWHAKAQGSSSDYGFHMAIARFDDGVAKEMADMAAAGVISYKLYMVYHGLKLDDGAIYRALKRAEEVGALIGAHCENWEVLLQRIEEQKAMGHLDPTGHPLSRPAAVEAEAVNRYLRIAELAGTPAYVVHLSTAEGFREAERARARGQKVYLETCPQYLVLDDSAYAAPDGEKFVMSPPLRKKADQEALWAGLGSGAIETVGTDHCSFTMEQKTKGVKDFSMIPNGGAGVQLRAQLLYTYGVRAGRLTKERMAAVLSANAAALFGMPMKGQIAPGADADIVVWDTAYRGSITHAALAHHCDNTPFEGLAVEGCARDVYLRGEKVVAEGKLVASGRGRYVHRKPR